MANNTNIEWCDATFNPWIGCTAVSRACDHCYAEAESKRRGWAQWGNHPRHRTSEAYWKQPAIWNRKAAAEGVRRKVFSASLSDWLDNQVPIEWLVDLLDVVMQCTALDWLLLTKRIQILIRRLREALGNALARGMNDLASWLHRWLVGKPPENVWLGTTVENQEEADRRIPYLLAVPAKVRFLSCEPCLGPTDLTVIRTSPASEHGVARMVNALAGAKGHIGPFGPTFTGRIGPRIDWVICGGESGPHARPMHPDWAGGLRDQCQAAGVPFFFKQWGEWLQTSSVDGYWHGPAGNQRAFPNSEGIAWLADGRVCLRDFSVTQHRRRIAEGAAVNTRAIEIDRQALSDYHRSVESDSRKTDNPLGLSWMYRVGKKAAGAMLDGREWREMPA